MHNLIQVLPVMGTMGIAAMLTGPLARLPIDLGAWALDKLIQRMSRPASTAGLNDPRN